MGGRGRYVLSMDLHKVFLTGARVSKVLDRRGFSGLRASKQLLGKFRNTRSLY